MKNKCLFGLLTLFLFFIAPIIVQAGSGSLSISSNNSLQPYKNMSIDVVGTAKESNIMGIQGVVASSNPSCIAVESISTVIGGSGANGSKFTYLDMTGAGFSGSKTIVKLNIKTVGQSCQATISISQAKISFTDGTNQNIGTIAKVINVTAPPSTNNNLSNLTVSAGSLSPGFNANTTNYTVNVDNTVSSINIGAAAADTKACVSGAGQRNLNYGSNTATITVKAENGDVKTYTITINRKDDRSSDNKLKSLNISNGSLSPGFNSDTTSYKMDVPYSVSKLNISANASDDKATVSINNPDLIAERTVNVTITVKAENGSTRTYTISVSRGKDPNKVLSTDNKLLSLVPSVGILSPIFDTNKNNYYVYLPYEIDRITFDYEVSDKTYATVKKTGEEELIPDSDNYYSFTVTAEDGSENTYTVTVNRAKNHDGETNDELVKKLKAQEEAENNKCEDKKENKIPMIILIIVTILLAGLSTILLLDKFNILPKRNKKSDEDNSIKKNKKKTN